MKRMNLRMVFVALMLMMAATVDAQLTDILKGALGKTSGNITTATQQKNQGAQTIGAVTSILQNLIGTDDVKQSALVGTWSYESPAVAFESTNMLKEAGGSIVASTLEKKAQTYLAKIGFEAGKVTLTFTKEGTFTMAIGSRTVEGNYSVEGNQITLSREGVLNYPLKANVAVALNELQITFKADKFLEFFTKLASMTTNSTISSIVKLAEGYDGMQLGFQFIKK